MKMLRWARAGVAVVEDSMEPAGKERTAPRIWASPRQQRGGSREPVTWLRNLMSAQGEKKSETGISRVPHGTQQAGGHADADI